MVNCVRVHKESGSDVSLLDAYRNGLPAIQVLVAVLAANQRERSRRVLGVEHSDETVLPHLSNMANPKNTRTCLQRHRLRAARNATVASVPVLSSSVRMKRSIPPPSQTPRLFLRDSRIPPRRPRACHRALSCAQPRKTQKHTEKNRIVSSNTLFSKYTTSFYRS